MKPLIIANWKMNPTSQKEAETLFEAIKKGVKSVKNTEVVICPPFIYLTVLSGLALGAQDVFYKEKGAFTGEVSVSMLKDLGVEYMIVGHSERRKYFNETNEIINKKIKESLVSKLKVILCVGETEDQKETKSQVLESQITKALEGVSNVNGQLSNVAIAYEPVWAIGTGNNCSVDEAQKSILFIRKIIANLYKREIADHLRILYGGSVKAENSGAYIKEGNANGLLVGGASLIAKEFIAIVKSAN